MHRDDFELACFLRDALGALGYSGGVIVGGPGAMLLDGCLEPLELRWARGARGSRKSKSSLGLLDPLTRPAKRTQAGCMSAGRRWKSAAQKERNSKSARAQQAAASPLRGVLNSRVLNNEIQRAILRSAGCSGLRGGVVRFGALGGVRLGLLGGGL
jgi:hypothetical protein